MVGTVGKFTVIFLLSTIFGWNPSGSSQKVEFLIQNTSLPAEKIIVRTSPKEFASQLHNALRAPTLNDDVCEAEKIDADGYDIIMDSLCSAYFKPGDLSTRCEHW